MQILLNILNNSKEAFSKKSEDNNLIFLEAKENNNKIIIKIKDTAGGIPKEILTKIYEPYFTTKHQYQGTGIGLFMCQEILSKHMNGKIDTKNVTFEYEDRTYKGALTTIEISIKRDI